MLNKINIVLMHTSHPGNIGAVARAMKTMGLSQLVLVAPKSFPSEQACQRASGADDILAQARVVESLDAAIANCGWVVGTSARSRTLAWPQLNPRQMAEQVIEEVVDHEVAIVLGCERFGLSNQALNRCHAHVAIPTVDDFSSLNLAAALQVLAYEIYAAHLQQRPLPIEDKRASDYPTPLATAEQLEGLYQHLRQILVDLSFLDVKQPKMLMQRLRRLGARTRLDIQELNILRGILAAMDKHISNKASIVRG